MIGRRNRESSRVRCAARLAGRLVLPALAASVVVGEARAVITTTCCAFGGNRSVTLRVGTATAGVIDTVLFNVGGAPVGNSLPTAPNPHGNGAPVGASTGAVVFRITMRVPGSQQPQPLSTTVTSPAGLSCISGPCTGIAPLPAIPFSSISWTASSPGGGDLQSGTFLNNGTQTIQSDVFPGFSFGGFAAGGNYDLNSTMTFTYANTAAFPAGVYRGTVVYTVTVP